MQKCLPLTTRLPIASATYSTAPTTLPAVCNTAATRAWYNRYSLEPPNLPLPSCPALPPPLRPPLSAAPPLPLGPPWSPPLPAPLQSQNARWCTPTRTVVQEAPAADGDGARHVCCAFLNAPLPAAAPSTAGERSKRDPWFKTEDNTMPEDSYYACLLWRKKHPERGRQGFHRFSVGVGTEGSLCIRILGDLGEQLCALYAQGKPGLACM